MCDRVALTEMTRGFLIITDVIVRLAQCKVQFSTCLLGESVAFQSSTKQSEIRVTIACITLCRGKTDRHMPFPGTFVVPQREQVVLSRALELPQLNLQHACI